MEKWKKTLLEWINGLELHKLTKSLDELQNGVFFLELLKILSHYDKIIQYDDEHIFKSLFKFVKYAYPDYELPKNDDAPSVDELVCICSLLMHHCTISAEEKVLRERMCRRLSMETQECITCFMQSILKHDGTVTKTVITNAIEESCNESTSSQEILSTECFSPQRSSLVSLTSFIQSPAARRQRDLEQRTREMRLLKAQLDTERDEKIDLQDEIKTLEERFEKMVKEIDKKNTIILNLKSQLVEMENNYQTPIKSNKDNTGKLRSNLHKAENRIEELQNELYEKQQQYNSLTYKLTACQQQCNDFKEKLSQYDQENNQLSKLTESQTEELKTLYLQNNELKEIIDEYKITQKMNLSDNSVCCTPGLTAGEERNLPLFIELELKEKEKIESENVKLNSDLNGMKNINSELENEVSMLKEIVRSLQVDLEVRSTEVSSYVKSVASLQENYNQLQFQLEDIKSENVILSDKNKDLNLVNKKLKKEMVDVKLQHESEIVNINSKSEETIVKLTTNYNDLQIQFEDVKTDLNNRLNIFEKNNNDLKSEISENKCYIIKIQNEISEKNNIIENISVENECYSKEIKNLQDEIINLNVLNDKEIFNLKLEYEKLITELKNVNNELEKKIQIQEVCLNEYKNCNYGLNNELKDCKSQIAIFQSDLERKQSLIEEFQLKLAQLDLLNEEIKLKNIEIQKSTSLINENKQDNERLKLELKELQEGNDSLKDDIETLKLDMAIRLSEVENVKKDLKIRIQDTEQSVSVLNDQLSNKLVELEEVSLVKDNLVNEVNNLQKQIVDIKESYEVKIINLSTHTDEITSKLNIQQEEFKQEVENLKSNIRDSKNENLELITKLNENKSTIENLQKEIVSKEGIVTNLSKELKNEIILKQTLEYQLIQLKKDNNILLESTKNEYDYKIMELTRKITELNDELNLKQKNFDKLIEDNNIVNNDLKSRLLNSEKKINNLTLSLDDKLLELGKIKDENSLLLVDVERLQKVNTDNKTSYEKRYNDLKTDSDSKILDFEQRVIELQEIIKSNELKLKETIESNCIINKKIEESESMIENLQSNFSNKEKYIDELNNKIENLSKDNADLTNNICVIKEKNSVEVEKINSEFIKKMAELNKINTDLNAELENTKTNLSQELADSKNFNVVLQHKLHDTELLIESLNTQVENLQKEIINNKMFYESEQENLKTDSCNKIADLEHNVAELKNINEQTVICLKKVENSKSELVYQLQEKTQMILLLQNDLNVKETNLVDSAQKLNELIEKNDELQKCVNETKEYLKTTENKLNEKIIQVEGVNCELWNKLSNTCANVDNLGVKLSEKEVCIAGLNEINVSLNQQLEELQKNIEDLKQNHVVQIEKIKSESHEKIIELNNIKECITKELQQVSNDLTSESSKVKDLLNKQTMLKKETENELLNVSKELADLKIQMEIVSKNLQDEKSLREETENKLHIEIEKTSVMYDLQCKIEDLQEKYSKLLISESDLSVRVNEFKLKSEHLFAENEKLQATITLLEEKEQKPNLELMTLRNAYEKVMSENSQLRLDCKVLKKTISERDNTISEVSVLKEAYEKLYKENYDLKDEVEVLQNKCAKDREEFKKAYERVKADTNVKDGMDIQIKELRTEYEVKLERMKTKMKQLCNEEILKVEKKKEVEYKNICKQYTEKINKYEEYIENLRSQLWTVGDKLLTEQKDREWLNTQLCILKQPLIKPVTELDNHDSIVLHELNKISVPLDSLFGSRDSIHSVGQEQNVKCIKREPVAFFINGPSTTKRDLPLRHNKVAPEESRVKKSSTLPKEFKQPMKIDDDSQLVLKKRNRNPPIDQGLHMEDEEGHVFNNTYLADLQAGRCNVREPGNFSRLSSASSSSRLSELQYRNSLCPPHLKSSYPAETQFHSPRQFTDDDLKMGIDYLKASLLPEEKPRRKDIGTTSYKKPGPPTPSKNGGRLSLQGNERDVLREHNENVLTQRKTTPSRLKALFMGRNTSTKDNSEVRRYGNLRSTCRSFHSFSPLLQSPISCPVPIKINPQLTYKSSKIYVWSSLLFILVLVTCITCVDLAYMSS